MGKVSSSYAAITRGVSEQVPQDRLPGQHWEQVNIISDPRTGDARRHGSITLDEAVLGIPALTADQQAYLRNYREYSFFRDSTEYSLVYQAAERPTTDPLPFCYCLNKETGQFLTVDFSESVEGALDPWKYGGLSAVATVGRFLVMASQSLGPGYSVTDKYAATSKQGVAWIRAGTYNRTFTLNVTRASDGKAFTASYTTMSSSYPNLLDTSDIVQDGNPNYAKQVNDRVNAYNSAATKWVGDANKDTQPQNIAEKLRVALVGAGFTDIARDGGTLLLNNVADVSASDSGDGSLFRAVFNETNDPAKLSTIHYNGKVVRVQPDGSTDAYYMVAKTDQGGATGTVTWSEGAAQVVQPGQVFAIAMVSDDGKTFTVADSPAQLATATGVEVPGYVASEAGDQAAAGAVPYFFGHRVTLLYMFMDRLVIVADGVVFMSRAGDYFNWFRKSMLKVDDDDPIEAYAQGAEDDVIEHAVMYSRDLFMFGKRNQYTVSGKTLLTPATVTVGTIASERDSQYAAPVIVGNLLYYGKYEAAPDQEGPSPYAASVSQFQQGAFEGSPEPYPISRQLDKYLRGRAIQFAALPAAHTLFVRTDGHDYGLYTYAFIDQPGTQARVFDSWSRWEWLPIVGRIIGMTTYGASLYVFSIRQNAQGPWVACDQFVMDAGLSTNPYLDAQRDAQAFKAGGGFFNPADPTSLDDVYVAGDRSSTAAFLGDSAANFDDFNEHVLDDGTKGATVGAVYSSSLTITSPYVRDRNDKALVNGRLVINRYTLSLTDTAALDATRTDNAGGVYSVKQFNGRRVGLSNNLVGEQPVTTATLDVPCGRANTEHKMTFTSRKWLPMTISAIEWVGQLFNNTRHV